MSPDQQARLKRTFQQFTEEEARWLYEELKQKFGMDTVGEALGTVPVVMLQSPVPVDAVAVTNRTLLVFRVDVATSPGARQDFLRSMKTAFHDRAVNPVAIAVDSSLEVRAAEVPLNGLVIIEADGGIPLGELKDLLDAVECQMQNRSHVVVVPRGTNVHSLTPDALRQLGWHLRGSTVNEDGSLSGLCRKG